MSYALGADRGGLGEALCGAATPEGARGTARPATAHPQTTRRPPADRQALAAKAGSLPASVVDPTLFSSVTTVSSRVTRSAPTCA
ncbi:hypothetical protein GCM10009544_42760 [Streptomyces stramineus]|uniref:Uncharacterized protein n=1 Tax=Streptomyces stramineus TaxID=173861 RepID=A0ABP3KC66_9ACTN